MLFKNNKYKLWYYKIILKAKRRTKDFIGEIHHIIPKSMNGSNKNVNLVKLTFREHFICHLLLTKMCIDKKNEIKMIWALHRITYSGNHKNSKTYSLVRKKFISNLKENHPSKTKKWRKNVSNGVKKSWKKDYNRKKQTSDRMKRNWIENRTILCEYNKNNSLKGIKAYQEKNKYKIEYYGKYYYSWTDLKNKTGVSKHLYRKYYMNGINPEYRINCNGPIKKEKEASV